MTDSAVEQLRQQLAQLGRDFLCETTLPAPVVKLRLIGPFQGNEVVWELTLTTLAEMRRHQPVPCPFIDIAPGNAGVHAVSVGLELPQIDYPAILKSLVMLRKYKRLAIGRHEFCPAL